LQIGLVKPSLDALRATAFGKLPNAAGWQPALPKTFDVPRFFGGFAPLFCLVC
jgi:hypothetical protein